MFGTRVNPHRKDDGEGSNQRKCEEKCGFTLGPSATLYVKPLKGVINLTELNTVCGNFLCSENIPIPMNSL